MPKYTTSVGAVLCLVSFLTAGGSLLAQRATTDATFSNPVQLPGVLLPAGSYHFSVAGDRRSVVVSDAGNRMVTILVVVPISRAKRGEVITMRPSIAGGVPEVSAIYSEGGTAGVEFLHRGAQK